MPPPGEPQRAFPGFLYTPGHGEHRLAVRADGTQDWEAWCPGMTLRQYYFGQALQGLFAHTGGNMGEWSIRDALAKVDLAIKIEAK